MRGEGRKGLLKVKQKTNVVPDDVLRESHLSFESHGHIGLPDAAVSLAYDPVQRLLAIGTHDGLIKVLGQNGVDGALISPQSSASQQLLFISQKGVLLRVEQDGKLELWSLKDGRLLDEVVFPSKVVTATWIEGTPYICCGSESGVLYSLQLLTSSSQPAEGVCHAVRLQILVYELLAEDLDENGPIIHLSSVTVAGLPRLLIVHSSGATIWDLRHQVSLGKTASGTVAEEAIGIADDCSTVLAQVGPIRSASWIKADGEMFATGHEMGQLLIWLAPLDPSDSGEAGAELVMIVRMNPDEDIAMPICSMKYVQGSRGSFDDSMLCLGGQSLDQPNSLSLVSLTSIANDKAPEIQSVPWYGNIKGFEVVPQDGSLGDNPPAGVILVLVEGGQLFVFDGHLSPNPFSPAFQELPQLIITTLQGSADSLQSPHAVSTERLQSARSLFEKAYPETSTAPWQWILKGGVPAEMSQAMSSQANILYSGHTDGRVRVWSAGTTSPLLQATVPFDSGGAGTKLRSVSAIEVSHSAGLLAVGHNNGEVRLYQFSLTANRIPTLLLNGSTSSVEFSRLQPPGFQMLLRMTASTAEIASIALDTCNSILAVGDSAGHICILDLAEPRMLHQWKAFNKAVSWLCFGKRPSSGSSQKSLFGDSDRLTVYGVSAAGEMVCWDAGTGENLGHKMTPKTASHTLSATLLDEYGSIIPFPAAPVSFSWAQNGAESPMFPGSPSSRSGNSSFNLRNRDPFHLTPTAEPGSEPPDLRNSRSSASFVSSSLSQQSSVEEDSFLAAAAEAADASNVAKARVRQKVSLKDNQPEKNIRHAREAMQRMWLKTKDSRDKAQHSATSPGAKPLQGGKQLVESLSLRAQGPAPSFIVVASSQFLRLYPADCFLDGERATLVKVRLEQQVAVAQAFTAREAPALACITSQGRMQVYSLPGLQPVMSQSLASIFGFSWSWEPQVAEKLQTICSISTSGEAFLPKPTGEAARLSLCQNAPSPVPCASLMDQDLNRAVDAAKQTRPTKSPARQSRQFEPVRIESNQEESAEDVSGDALDLFASPTDSLMPCYHDQKKGFGNLFSQVRGGVANVGSLVESTGKGIGKELGNVLGSRGRKNRKPTPPSLERVLNSKKELLPSTTALSSNRGSLSGTNTRPTPRSFEADNSRRRAELRTDRVGPVEDSKAGPRSADEIRMAYGRPARHKSETAASIALENRSMLAERGEKLSQLSSKAENMANDASNFASIAQQLRIKEANKKWWQF